MPVLDDGSVYHVPGITPTHPLTYASVAEEDTKKPKVHILGRDRAQGVTAGPPSPHRTAWCLLEEPCATILVSLDSYLPSVGNNMG